MKAECYYIEVIANGIRHKQYIESEDDLLILSELFKKIERNAKQFVEESINTDTEEHF